MKTGYDEPQAFDIILLLLFGGRSVVAGNKPVTFASEIGHPNENQDYCEKDEPPNHTNYDSTVCYSFVKRYTANVGRITNSSSVISTMA